MTSPPPPPSPEPAAEAPITPPRPASEISPPLSPEDRTPPPPPLPPAQTPIPPPRPASEISPPLSPEDRTPPPPPLPPAQTPIPPPLPASEISPPLSPENPKPPPPPTSAAPEPPPLPPPPPRPPPPPPPAPEAEAVSGESGNLTLALALTLADESTPPTPTPPPPAPTRSPLPKESTLTIAKLLSGEENPPAEPAAKVAAGDGRGVGSKRWLLGGVPEKVRRAELRRAEIGCRVSVLVLCLVSLSVMAADSTPGWAGDSFRRYNEYSLAATVVGFAYSGFQVVSEVHYIVTGKHIFRRPWGGCFNLAMDQMVAYLLLSASSAALSRNGVTVSRFGVDQFAKLINASASMAFLAFIALGVSSIISAYNVFSSIS